MCYSENIKVVDGDIEINKILFNKKQKENSLIMDIVTKDLYDKWNKNKNRLDKFILSF